MPSYLRPALLMLMTTLATAGTARAQDLIYRQNRPSPLRGTVVSLSPTEVSVEAGGQVQSISVADVEKITFGEEPDELRAARDQIRVGHYQAAEDNLNSIAINQVTREFIVSDIAFYRALAAARLGLAGNGQIGEAEQLMRAYFSLVRNGEEVKSHHYFPACEVYGDLQVRQDEFELAARVYSELEAAPWPETKLRGLMLQGQALQQEGQYETAAEKFTRVVSEAPDSPQGNRQRLLATVGRAACQARTGQHEEAIAALEQVIADNNADQDNTELFARTYNALGAAYLAAGQTQEALLAYLHVDLLYNAQPDAHAEAHAEALYHLAQIWSELQRNHRASQARGRLEEQYSTTVWARRQ